MNPTPKRWLDQIQFDLDFAAKALVEKGELRPMFSIVTTTMCSMLEFSGFGRLGKFRRTSCANNFLPDGHDAPTNAAPETNAAFFNNSRRFTFMMSLPDLDDLQFGLFQLRPESASRLGIARSTIGQG